MRTLLNRDTTFINRENTNEKNIRKSTDKSHKQQKNNKTRNNQNKKAKKPKQLFSFTEFYKTMKLKIIEKIINSTAENHRITFDEKLRPRIAPARRPGRPMTPRTPRETTKTKKTSIAILA